MDVRFAILGPVEVGTDEGEQLIKNGRERFVLALLLLSADRLTPTDRLIDALWEEPPPTARAQLHNIIRSLRRRLGDAADTIVTRPLGYELRLDDHELDLLEFRRLVARGRQAAVEGDPARAADTLDAALALWRGPALADVDDKLAADARRKLHQERATAATELLAGRLRLGQQDEVLRQVPALIEEHPHQERLYEMQMRALAATGQRAEALDTYQRAYRRLVDDLGVEPGPVLRDLEQQVLQGKEVAPTAPAMITPRQLPAMLTTLTGRDKLIAEVATALSADASGQAKALLVGPGGIGKTTLATAVGHQVADRFPDGQLYADLRGSHDDAADPHDVLAGILRALGVAGSALPDDADERAALYRSLLADKRALVLFDDAADERQVRPLLPGSAGCGVIVTSRQRLSALVDASRWTVPGLQPTDAVDLVERIVGPDRVGAEPEAATSIVEACGHLPLAVSIAAARLATRPERSLAEFADRLSDVRRRLDELTIGDLDVRASIALSYEALDPDHRCLLRRLGLFTSPDWPSWVAHEAVQELTDHDVEAALDHLADAHLIESLGRDPVGQTRFRLHDLVAEYVHERALAEERESDRTDVVTRVLSGWLALASEADDHIEHGYANVTEDLTRSAPPAGATLPVADTAKSWFDTERTNLTAAVTHACRVGRTDLAGELAIRLSGYSLVYGYQDDLQRTLEAARVCVREAGQDELLYRVLVRLYNCVVDYGSVAVLEDVASEILDVARRLGRTQWFGRACIDMCVAMLKQGRIAAADKWLSEGQAAVETDDDPRLHAGFWNVTAMVRIEAGRAAEAVAPMERALDFQRQAGRTRVVAVYLSNYGEVLLANSRLSDAEAILTESTQLAHEFGDETYPAYNECKLAEVDLRRGDTSKAARRLADARQIHETGGTVDGLADVDRTLGELDLAAGRPSDAIQRFGQACQTWRSLDVPLNIARLLLRLELAHSAAGDTDAAEECQREWRSIVDNLELDETCLPLPPFLTDDRPS